MVAQSPDANVTDGTDPPNTALDEAFDVLSHRRRRAVLACLSNSPRSMALADLAHCVARRENDGMDATVSKEDVQQVRATLHHTHVPKLAEAGTVEYDRDRQTVSLSHHDTRVEQIRSFAAGNESVATGDD